MISKEEIQNLSALARVKVSDEEIEMLQKDISNILDYIGQLSAEKGVSASAPLSASSLRNVMRDDTPRADNDLLAGKRESLLQALPKREGDYNVVRKIIQKDE